MSPAHVFAPTYAAIRGKLASGAWPMGCKLETARLADDLGVSLSPVRDSLNQLVGEGLVDFIPGVGFLVPLMAEAEYKALLDLQFVLLRAAVEAASRWQHSDMRRDASFDRSDPVTQPFEAIAFRSGNKEIVRVLAFLDARLASVRMRESECLAGVDDEARDLALAACTPGNSRALLSLLRSYHRRRKRAAACLMAGLR